ncbi:hypothetical protein DPMN_050149 [Dreissena polymorpha]|uniref:Uncharacterized protein n=1 Tax=Dreissena polymorpha TaxID=45954 RepID=A0A9D4HNZ6_DREPO|nr:hypothetical protein DPMN_050149 [Dreissena polymorpha]
MRGGHSILIFCPTKNWCESLAEQVARELYRLLRDPSLAVHKQPGILRKGVRSAKSNPPCFVQC